MNKKLCLSLLMLLGSLTISSVSPTFILKAEDHALSTLSANTLNTYATTQKIPWESQMDASWLDPNKPIIALTFDDGPVWSGSSASDILDILSAYDAHATFFYCGTNINETTQSEIARAYSLGHEIGNHTTDHLDLSGMTKEKILYEVNSTAELLSEITGLDQFLVRTPYCSSNETILNTIQTPLISAALDSYDYNGLSTDEIVDRVLALADDGAIVLMHEPLSTTSEAVKIIVPELIKRGYQLASVSEMMAAKGITMTSGEVYTYAPLPSHITTVLDGATISYAITSQWPGNYVGEISITNTGDAPISDWQLDFDLVDTVSTVWSATLESSQNGHTTISNGTWNQTINPGETGTFSICISDATSVPKIPSNYVLTLADGTIIDTPSDDPTTDDNDNSGDTDLDDNDNPGDTNLDDSDNSGNIENDDSGNSDDSELDDGDNSGDTELDDSDSSDDIDNGDNGNSDDSELDDGDNSGDIDNDNEHPDLPTSSPLTVTPNLNSWGTGYTCTVRVSNSSDTPIDTWALKVLAADFDITNYWCCTITEEGEYLIITPATYNATIPANGSVEFGIQGNGLGSSNFEVISS